ncbi:MAG TPA: hypothetical protein DCE56_05355 [Cyanobacteria bacterium UBA8553]|nr:hypothetical protein [Cyanobacteria bacterium UBA8553]HAJ59971.1 hypothetical protein [Cyanobacteria bacterium UBA8543]
MNQICRLIPVLAIAIVASSTVTGCSSQQNPSPIITPTYPTPVPPEPTPTAYPTPVPPEPTPIPTKPSTFSQNQCPVDISGILSKLQNTTQIIDPIILRNSSIGLLEEGKLAWRQISTDPNCGRETKELRFLLQTCWQRSLGADYDIGQTFASLNQASCTANCQLSDGSEICIDQCDKSYQNALERLARERDIGDKEMNDFFR